MAAAKNPSRITILVLIMMMICFNSLIIIQSEAGLYYQISLINSSAAEKLRASCTITVGKKSRIRTLNLLPSAKDSFAVIVKPEKNPAVQVARCSIIQGSLFGDFILFDSRRDGSRCPDDNCVWRINEQGLFFRDLNNNFVLEFKWPSAAA